MPDGERMTLRQRLDEVRAQLATELRGHLHNFRGRNARARILVLRDRGFMRSHNDPFLGFVRAEAPDVYARLVFRYLPTRISERELAGVALVVPWLQDPLRERDPKTFAWMEALEARCRTRGIAVLQPVGCLSNAIKSRAAELIGATGLRTPLMQRLYTPAERAAFKAGARTVGLPFFVREDHGHGGPIHLVHDEAEVARLPLDALAHPVAIEWIDTRWPDGFYRKWRYVCVGARGVPRHLLIADGWKVHAEDRVLTPATIAEEQAYVMGDDPFHAQLQQARAALGMDFVAFDYSLDAAGRPVVWEPNPLPVLWAPFNEARADFQFQRPTIARVFATMLTDLLERAAG